MRALSSPSSDGAAKSGPMIIKRKRAHRTRTGVSSSWGMPRLALERKSSRRLEKPYATRVK